VCLVTEVSKVEQAGATARALEELPVERQVAISKEAVHEHERLERDDVVTGAGEPAGAARDGGGNMGTGSGGEVEDLTDVALLGRLVVVASDLDDEHVELRRHVAGDLGEADAGLVLDRPERLPDRARRHLRSPPCPRRSYLLRVTNQPELKLPRAQFRSEQNKHHVMSVSQNLQLFLSSREQPAPKKEEIDSPPQILRFRRSYPRNKSRNQRISTRSAEPDFISEPAKYRLATRYYYSMLIII
jgi:hypothetical protein